MAIHLTCPECSKTFQVSEASRGKIGKCSCGASIQIGEETIALVEDVKAADQYIIDGLAAYERQDFINAEKLFTLALETDYERYFFSVPLNMIRAYCHCGLGNKERFESATLVFVQSEEPFYSGDRPALIEIVEKGLAIYPDHPYGHWLLCRAFCGDDDLAFRDQDRVMNHAQLGLKAGKPISCLYEELARAHSFLGDFSSATSYQQRAIQLLKNGARKENGVSLVIAQYALECYQSGKGFESSESTTQFQQENFVPLEQRRSKGQELLEQWAKTDADSRKEFLGEIDRILQMCEDGTETESAPTAAPQGPPSPQAPAIGEMLTRAVAEEFVTAPNLIEKNRLSAWQLSAAGQTTEFFFSRFSSMDREAAQVLANYQGDLYLNGITTLPLEIAEILVKHQGLLSLNGLTEMSVELAEKLSTHRQGSCSATEEWIELYGWDPSGDLWLDGLTSLTSEVAGELIGHEGRITFDGLTELSIETAVLLAIRSGRTGLNSLVHLPPDIYQVLEQGKGHLEVGSLQHPGATSPNDNEGNRDSGGQWEFRDVQTNQGWEDGRDRSYLLVPLDQFTASAGFSANELQIIQDSKQKTWWDKGWDAGFKKTIGVKLDEAGFCNDAGALGLVVMDMGDGPSFNYRLFKVHESFISLDRKIGDLPQHEGEWFIMIYDKEEGTLPYQHLCKMLGVAAIDRYNWAVFE